MQSQASTVDRLRELARNMWWTWQPNVIQIFRDLDPTLWRMTDHNPVEFLKRLPADQIEKRAADMALHSRIDSAFRRLHEYLTTIENWAASHALVLRSRPVAYFSMEFGLHESLPIYSGGLGVLAGDHLKSASDLGVPLVGVGLLYNQGYFRQSLDNDGMQQETYSDTNRELLPIEPAFDAEGRQVEIAIDTNDGVLRAEVWRVEVGRTTLFLLDSNVAGNSESDRSLTARLYGGDALTRIRQELLLGIGGVRALHALGYQPSVLHLNEGHSAFATLEFVRKLMVEQSLSFPEAVREVARMTVFTTHTPVPAGHDRFEGHLVEEHLGKFREKLAISEQEFLGLGRVNPSDPNERFCMTVLALKLSRHANGVSALHGVVSRQMWQPMYPQKAEEEVPIGHITNGVHVLSWLAPQMKDLYDRHLGIDWPMWMCDPRTWKRIETANDGEFFEVRQVLKARLIDFVRRRLVFQAQRRHESDAVIARAERALDPGVLTIGFARRFATYKRATLLLRDAQRITEILTASDLPVQVIYAGKAHPEDKYGKDLIQQIARMSRHPELAERLVFVEDYDMNIARHLVQGVDVWLNNPRRPQEASGTSGEKVLLNGGLNFSILDGWWAEAYDGFNGFAIGTGLSHADFAVQDERDHQSLMKTLVEEIVPLYYKRDESGLPRDWIARVKHAIRSLSWRFNADRMVKDYVKNGYLPAAGGLSCEMIRMP